MPAHVVAAETAEVEIEVGMDRHEATDLVAGGALAQPFGGLDSGHIIVAGDIEDGLKAAANVACCNP
jgi:hypothetical protein